jgi:hypothetical protein
MATGLWMLLALGACHKEAVPVVRQVAAEAVLPLSGPLAAAGNAFAQGLRQGLTESVGDSVRIGLSLLDNASGADSAAALLAAPRAGLLVAGLGGAADGLPPRTSGFSLLVGQDAQAPAGWTSIGCDARTQADSLLRWCRSAPKPLAIVFPASGRWAPLVQELLAPRLDSVALVPHDDGETTWNREATRLQSLQPRSVLLWHGLEQARSLLARPDLVDLFARARVLGPEGAGTKETWGPVWEPSPAPDSLELGRWQAMGRQAAARLRQAATAPSAPQSCIPLAVRAAPAPMP